MFSQIVASTLLALHPAPKAIAPAVGFELRRFSDRWVPPSKTGWSWCEEMHVWVPEQLPYFTAEIAPSFHVPGSPKLARRPCSIASKVDTPRKHKAATKFSWGRQGRKTAGEPKPKPTITVIGTECAVNGVSFVRMYLIPVVEAQQIESARRGNMSFFLQA
ncbi:uncharacterized protein LAESUDRAFT_812972 [Laetiporus sulphureus 93-53]|uniref:Uncharacterized protein n=1 Tax=Laetiporus sulphureus 93-53 TaxID=1314785 RepID=A0A165E0V0_9APHY|nr:uncharacterized protein LAESUDRAFT_812972 [Laetiporus sulphureus 93-53]KZT06029.1 hypothetical protein LAESUDRAFT_812972 [Laetiporus sulphureus 93-53]